MLEQWRINLVKLRGIRGLSQADLALKSGVSQGQISLLETGKRTFTQETLDKLLKVLGARYDQLFGHEDKKISIIVEHAEKMSEIEKDEVVKVLHKQEQERKDTALFQEFKKMRHNGKI